MTLHIDFDYIVFISFFAISAFIISSLIVAVIKLVLFIDFFTIIFGIYLFKLDILLKLIHILQVLLVLHFERCHWECLLVEKGYDTLLA